ncbi:hypothetical protein D023_1681B, partial [Vibrio parahaemolyticus 3256]
TEQITMIEDVIEVVDIFSFMIARQQWHHRFIPLIELRLEPSKQFSHRDVAFSVPPIACRIETNRAKRGESDITIP